jgi:radical SAM superfamily enzyme YgiQ (UPF0313 family)
MHLAPDVELYWPHIQGKDNLIENLRQKVSEVNPDVVGISFRNLDSCTSKITTYPPGIVCESFLNDLVRIVNTVKRQAHSPVTVLGGSGFSIAPEELLLKTGGDFGFIGPAERGFAELIRVLISNKKRKAPGKPELESIEGIVFRKRDQFIRGPLANMDGGSPCAVSDWEKTWESVALATKEHLPVRTMSGCPLRCTYCVVPTTERLSVRNSSEVMDEIEKLWLRWGRLTRIFFADGEFNLPASEKAESILRELILRGLSRDIRWSAYLHPRTIQKSFVKLAEESGCDSVSLSIDSFDDHVLKKNEKGFSAREAIEAIKTISSFGIATYINLLFGLPGETSDSIAFTCRMIKELNSPNIHWHISIGARIYPGTALSQIAERMKEHTYGSCDEDSTTPSFYCEPYSPNELLNRITLLSSGVQDITFGENNIAIQTGAYEHGSSLVRGLYLLESGNERRGLAELEELAETDCPLSVDASWAITKWYILNAEGSNAQKEVLRTISKASYYPNRISGRLLRRLASLLTEGGSKTSNDAIDLKRPMNAAKHRNIAD